MTNKEKEFDMNSLCQELVSIRTMQQKSLDGQEEINKKLDNIQNVFQPLVQEVESHAKEIKYLDQDKRRKNLIVFGLEEARDETVRDLETKVLNLILNTLQIKDFTLLELDISRRQGKRRDNDKPRPVLISFTTQRRKIEILKNKGKLKGSNIYIHEDSSPAVREQEKQLRGEMRRLRSEGKFAVIRSGRLITNNSISNKKRALSESPKQEASNSKRVNMNVSDTSSCSDMFVDSNTETGVVDQQNAAQVEQTNASAILDPPGSTAPPIRQTPSIITPPTLLAPGSLPTPALTFPNSARAKQTGSGSQPTIANYFQTEGPNLQKT
ncbi:hypothetical protein WDU94_003567 [Cyamophila willieti]